MRFESLGTIIGAVIAVLAQIIIAPNIAIFSAMPNFLLVYILVIALVKPGNNSTLVVAFTLGLLYDLLGHGPVGAMAFLAVLTAFISSRLFVLINNDTFFIPFLMLFVMIFVVEISYAVFLTVFGISAGPLEAIVHLALPCALYDCAVALICYPLATRFISGTSSSTKKATPTPTPMTVSAAGGGRPRKTKKKMPRF